MRHHATTVVALLSAAGLLFSAFPAATAADVAVAPTGVTIPKGYRNGMSSPRPSATTWTSSA
jgi:hypothetical protein